MEISRKCRPIFFHIHREPIAHWEDSKEMHRVMHTLDGPVRALLLERNDNSIVITPPL